MAAKKSAYAQAGVDIDVMMNSLQRIKKNVKSTNTKGVMSEIGSFGGLFQSPGKEFLLVASAEGGEGEAKSPLGLERVSVQATAEQLAADAARLPEFRTAYLARFPDAGQMFGFADFSMFLIRPVSARFVAGFGQAHSLSAEALLQILRR